LWLTLAVDGGGQLHFPGALSPMTQTPVVTEEGAGWGPRVGMDVLDKRKKKIFYTGRGSKEFPRMSTVPTDFCKIYPVVLCCIKMAGRAAVS